MKMNGALKFIGIKRRWLISILNLKCDRKSNPNASSKKRDGFNFRYVISFAFMFRHRK